MLGCYI
ncbi:hypothetical protein F383_22406 [Gossypium arboreum]|nr:hypothetical protein F383_22406 [Gossypium arboreum]